jgi:hypothetical protein
MTTYTLTESERQTLMEAIQGPIYGEPVFGKPTKDALKFLANLQPNTQESVALIRRWTKNDKVYAELVYWCDHIDNLQDGEHKLYTAPIAEPLEFPEPMKVSTAPSYDFANGWNACLATINAKRGVK